jgi:hypothetical protein
VNTRNLQPFFDPGFQDRRVWHSEELRAILEHQWQAPLRADLSGHPRGQSRRLTLLCDAEHLLLKSFGDVFDHKLPPIELLVMIKDFAKGNLSQPDAELPDEIAKLLYVLSVVVARVRCRTSITTQEDATVRRNIESVLAQPWLTAHVVELLNEGLAEFRGEEEIDGGTHDTE